MKIAIAQLNYHIGNFSDNVRKIVQHISKARDEGADLVVFAELAICGYPPRDFLEFEEFIDRCELSLSEIAKESHGIGIIVGCPVRNRNGRGKKLYNAACFLTEGTIEFVQHKTLLPTYDIFDEHRYFEPNSVFDVIEFKGKKIALTICEDLWNISREKLYEKEPMEELNRLDPDLVVNISASPFSVNHYTERSEMLKTNADKYGIPFVYVNHVGAQTELIFDGKSMVFMPETGIVHTIAGIEEDF